MVAMAKFIHLPLQMEVWKHETEGWHCRNGTNRDYRSQGASVRLKFSLAHPITTYPTSTAVAQSPGRFLEPTKWSVLMFYTHADLFFL